jgi:hypothetical protein
MNAYLKALFIGFIALIAMEIWYLAAPDLWNKTALDIYKIMPSDIQKWFMFNTRNITIFTHCVIVFYSLLTFALIGFFVAFSPKDKIN